MATGIASQLIGCFTRNWLFHTLSLGEIAVDGFFLISGYLITMSYMNSKTLTRYLQRRVFRVYPAFIVAYLVSVFALGPLVGAHPWRFPLETIVRLVGLEPPMKYPGQFPGLHYGLLNGSLWTIAFEFRCYLMVALFGLLGFLDRRWIVFTIAIAGLIGIAICSVYGVGGRLSADIAHLGLFVYAFTDPGQPLAVIRLTTAFLVGMCFYLFRTELMPRLTLPVAAGCAAACAALLFHDPHFAEVALLMFGSCALFWLAFHAKLGRLQRINDQWDISYGVYLYGWPIAIAVRWFDPGITPVTLATTTLILAMAAGSASWWALEKWTKNLALSSRLTNEALVG